MSQGLCPNCKSPIPGLAQDTAQDPAGSGADEWPAAQQPCAERPTEERSDEAPITVKLVVESVLWAFAPLGRLEIDFLPFREGPETIGFDVGVMDK